MLCVASFDVGAVVKVNHPPASALLPGFPPSVLSPSLVLQWPAWYGRRGGSWDAPGRRPAPRVMNTARTPFLDRGDAASLPGALGLCGAPGRGVCRVYGLASASRIAPPSRREPTLLRLRHVQACCLRPAIARLEGNSRAATRMIDARRQWLTMSELAPLSRATASGR